ncbi:MAG TPA: DNA repair protein RadC [Spirochaetota bacterium]|nr:DNA repair protein RadC [Spirochaetota bacterium]HSA13521.1 DNA repair protein RadC [Spirochaetota bacterium]
MYQFKIRTSGMNIAARDARQSMPLQKCINGEEIRNLADRELLAVILGTGTRNCGVMDLSSRLLAEMGGISGIAASGIREIAELPGMGMAKSVRIHSAIEMGRRAMACASPVCAVNTPEAVWQILIPDMIGIEKEKFMALVLNNKNRLIKKSLISLGTVSEAIVHPREVFREAIREGGSSIIIAHNHPSGVLTPSREDIRTTSRLAESGAILGIPLLDHVIVTSSSFLSMKEEGYIK